MTNSSRLATTRPQTHTIRMSVDPRRCTISWKRCSSTSTRQTNALAAVVLVIPSVTPIYCINLASSTVRRRRMLGRFDHHALTDSVSFVDAVAAADGEVDRVVSGAAPGSFHRPTVATLRSHLAALHRFLDDTDPATTPGAIVCEDDVMLHNDFAARLTDTLTNLPHDAPLVSLGYLIWNWTDMPWVGVDPSLENLAALNPAHVWGTQAYWISRAAAQAAISALDRPLAELPADVTAEAITRGSGGFIAYPPLVLEEALDTTIGETERLDHHRDAQRGFPVAAYSAGERTARTATISLCMIVRNEAAVLGRCIASVRHLIDHWVICDTGSTDGTQQLIVSLMEGIPGELHHRPWVDFGHNRSELMALAAGRAQFLLLLDADQTLYETGTLPELTADVYRLRHTGSMEYDVSRLVRGTLPWRFEGRTHEYLVCDSDASTTDALTLAWQVVHHADGGSRSTKFERDRDLLEMTLREFPDDPRTLFYLAQTLETLGDHDSAADLYERRSALGGFEEEAWFASLRAAVLRSHTNAALGLGQLLACWQRRPSRLEPLHEVAEVCARNGWWHIAHATTAAGLDIARPDDILFVHRWLYDGGLRADHERACRALGRPIPGTATTSPEPETPTLEALLSAARFAHVVLVPAPSWPQFNPSIAVNDDEVGGFAMVVRTANYHLVDGRYHFLDESGNPTSERIVQTRNYFVSLDAELTPTDVREIRDRSGRATHATNVLGLEDYRLFRWRDGWWAVATSRDSNPSAMARVLLLELDSQAHDAVDVVSAVELPAPSPTRHEKNWAPFVTDGGELQLMYGWDPLRVLRWDGELHECEVEQDTGSQTSREWRGSSQGVRLENGWLFVVHEVLQLATGRRYTHRFVVLADEGRVSYSAQFSLTSTPIEFATGLAVRRGEVVVSFGVNDALAALVIAPLSEVLAMVRCNE